MKKKFKYFFYFYGYLKYRLFLVFLISLLVGILDGFGLAMFIPLLKLVSSNGSGIKTEGDAPIINFVVHDMGIVPSLLNILLLIFVFFCLKGAAKLIEGYFRVIYQQFFMRKIRILNIELLSNYDFLNFSKSDVGRIQNTMSGEVGRVNSAFRFYFKSFQFAVLVVAYVIMAFAANPQFALMVSVGGFFTNFLFKFLYKRTKYFSKKLTQKNHVFQALLFQKINLFKYLKTTAGNYFYGKKLKKNIWEMEHIQRKIGVVDSLLYSLREPVVILIVIVAIYLQVQFFDENIGLIFLSLLLLYRALSFFMAMQEQWNFFLGVSGSLENMQEFTQELQEGKEQSGSIAFTGFKEKLSLQNVFFQYGNFEVLKKINLEIYKNQTIAIVGESGSGKSTLMNIISGLLLPTSGDYYIDDIPINDLERSSFRGNLGYIPQEPAVFNDTIYNNVTFWAEKNPENLNKFYKAIKRAELYDYVTALSNKEMTLLGNNGINLSGGQKQRLSIARELFKEVEFLLLDEATSSLDGETEWTIQQNIDKLKGHYTIIIIAHRLATIKNADKIVLLNKGEIESFGTFNELSRSSIHFQEMIKLQNL